MNTKPIADPILRANTAGMLAAFAAFAKPMYLGTVPRAVIDKRRAKNRAARKARRNHR